MFACDVNNDGYFDLANQPPYDLNGDGNVEFLSTDSAYVFINQGDGTFKKGAFPGADLSTPDCRIVADLDADVADLAAAVEDLEMGAIMFDQFYLYNDEIITTVDDGGGDDVGRDTSIAIGTDGLPVISYFDDVSDDLEVAHCNDPLCSPDL